MCVFIRRVYNCDTSGCPANNSYLTKDVYRSFNTEAVRLFVLEKEDFNLSAAQE